MAYAEVSDVQARLGRPLTDDEEAQAVTLLADVEMELLVRIPDLHDQVADEKIPEANVIRVEASVVARLLRNPEGYTSETDGNYTYQLNYRLTTGELSISQKEWSLLGVNSGIFLINPKVKTPFESLDGSEYPWNDPTSPIFQYNDIFWNDL